MPPEAILRRRNDRWLATSLTPLGGDNRVHFRHHQPQKSTVRESGAGPVNAVSIEPRVGRYRIKIPDATPEIIAQHALSDEQALLARVRVNRLIDIFTGLTAYSLQNHFRSAVGDNQLEIDELYVAIAKTGAQHVIPVEAKSRGEKLGRLQLTQDAAFCAARFPGLRCRPVAIQALPEDGIAMFELFVQGDEISVVDERHYQLVVASEIHAEDLARMSWGE